MSVEGFTKMHDGRWRGYSQSAPKWRCDVCERTGYGTSEYPYGANLTSRHWGWAKSCLNGHAPCPWCGRQQALRKDGTPRVHSRCPERPDDAELLRLCIAEAKDDARRGVRGPLDRQAVALLERLTRGGAA